MSDHIRHVVPVDDLMGHDETEACPCGPTVEFVNGGQVIVHHSLDGREVVES